MKSMNDRLEKLTKRQALEILAIVRGFLGSFVKGGLPEPKSPQRGLKRQ